MIPGAPQKFAVLTKAEMLHGMQIYAGARTVRELPRPNDRDYPYLKMRGMQIQLEKAWMEGTAKEEGIVARPEEIAEMVRRVKGNGNLRELFGQPLYTRADLREAVKLLVLRQKLAKRIGRVYAKVWPSRTYCAPGFVVEGCAQWDPADHPGKRVHFVN